MNDADQNTDKKKQHSETRLKINPRTGLPVISGPSFTKEDVAKDFPVDCCRDASILRRSVRLPKIDPFDQVGKSEIPVTDLERDPETDTLNIKGVPFSKENVAKNFPRDCCRFSRSIRRSVGLSGNGLAADSDKCCFVD